MSHLVLTINNCEFCIYEFLTFLSVNSDYFWNNINQLILVKVKCGVLFEVRSEFLIIIKTNNYPLLWMLPNYLLFKIIVK
jgi:hypothetical protein